MLNFTGQEHSGTESPFSFTTAAQLQAGEENIWLYTGCLNEISVQYFFSISRKEIKTDGANAKWPDYLEGT